MSKSSKIAKLTDSEKQRILEIQSLTYFEQLERLMKLIELSYTIKTSKIIEIVKN